MSSVDDGFVDWYLIGVWRDVDFAEEDETSLTVGEVEYVVSFDGIDKFLRIESERDDGGKNIYEGYTTLLDGKKYLNLKFVDCIGCDTQGNSNGFFSDCPYRVIQYQTYVPQKILDLLTSDHYMSEKDANAVFAGWKGRLLFVQGLANSSVVPAIREGVIEGELSCDDCDEPAGCITAESETLREFVKENEAELYGDVVFSSRILARDVASGFE